jgi:hypothetical protein
MDINKLSPGERIIAAAGILLFVDSFFPWFRYCLPIGNVSILGINRPCANYTAWSSLLSTLAVLIAMAMVVQIAVTKFGNAHVPAPGTMSWGQVHLFAGFAVVALVLLQFLAGKSPAGRSFGVFLGIGIAAGLAYGGMVRSREPEPTVEGGPA